MIIRIESPYFVAGIVREKGRPQRYAPILRWMARMKLGAIKRWCIRKGYQYQIMEEEL